MTSFNNQPIDLSFIILTWNSESYLDACLASIYSSLDDESLAYEILIVDNGSTDGTVKKINAQTKARKGLIKPIYLTQNMGTTVSRNLGLRQAVGRYLCVMDSDVELAPGLFPPLIEVLNSEPKSGMVVPKINYPNGHWQKSFDRFPTITHKIKRFFKLREIEYREALAEKEQTQVRTVDYAISAFWLIKRELLETVGFLDEKIFYSPEDVDYCLRVWKTGHKIVYVPSVEIIHHTQEISRGFKLNRAKVSHLKGLLYLFVKHRYFFQPPKFSSRGKGTIRILYHHRTIGDGAEGIHIREMVNAFRELGHEVMLVGPGVAKQNKDNRERQSSSFSWVKNVFRGPAYEIVELAYNLFGFIALRKAIKSFQPDFIYDRYITFNYSSVATARKYGLPIFLEVNSPLAYERDHESDEALYLKRIAYYIERKVCCDASKTIVVSTPLKQYLESIGVSEKQIKVLPNGVNVDKFYPVPESQELKSQLGIDPTDVVVGFVGILRPWHGIDFLLKAFKPISDQLSNCQLLLVGDGPIRGEIERIIIELNLQDKVVITGRVEHESVKDYVALFDVAVSPKATFYASPMKIVEYMAQQKAVLAPDMLNIRDLIVPGETGILFKEGDRESFSTNLMNLIENKTLRDLLGEKALKVVRERQNWVDNARYVINEFSEQNLSSQRSNAVNKQYKTDRV